MEHKSVSISSILYNLQNRVLFVIIFFVSWRLPLIAEVNLCIKLPACSSQNLFMHYYLLDLWILMMLGATLLGMHPMIHEGHRKEGSQRRKWQHNPVFWQENQMDSHLLLNNTGTWTHPGQRYAAGKKHIPTKS